MNKRCHKVIFSKTLGQMVVVSEKATTSGKTSRGNTAGKDITVFTIKALRFALMLLSGSALLLTTARAQIIADGNASQAEQPIVLQTASGAAQVDIQTPNDQGVSMNRYRQFDVDHPGAVLNNSHRASQTHIAGWVPANPNMARGEANVIVNQVASTNPSNLNGYIEVAGKRADVIIANPAGISVSGAGFINAGQAVLTTGTPVFHQGQLNGYNIEQGQISVGQKGMDVRDTDYTAILSRHALIDGPIYQADGKLDIITGVNQLDRQNHITRTAATTTNKPAYAIDSSTLGGMYAGSIRIISTEKGVGINNAGHWQPWPPGLAYKHRRA